MATEIAAIREKRELVDRIAKSVTFQKSPRLREFLVYVADCTLDDRLEDTREQQIASHVFNRKPDYNPGQDNIVRVEARSLRKRLELYFASEGKDEPFMVSMPKGSYSLAFEPRPEQSTAETHVELGFQGLSEIPVSLEITRKAGTSRWLIGLFCLLLVTLSALVAEQWQTRHPEKPATRSAPVAFVPLSALPFSAVIDPMKDTYVVTSDCALVLIEDLKQQQISLDDYITGRYMADSSTPASDPAMQDFMRKLLKRRYTNSAETGVAGRIIQRYAGSSQRLLLRSGHGVQLADFKNHNAILFGSPASNPWATLFSEKLNFQYDWDRVRRGMITNRSPRQGEQAVYSMTTNPGDSGKAYATVALVPNVSRSGNVLLVAGTTAEGTEAAGEFITDEARTSAALRSLGIDPAGPPRYFEILLEAKAVAGSASQSTILAARLISDSQ